MAGFNLPITAFTPQMLAEMAQAAYKPPALMGGGGGGGGGLSVGGSAAPAGIDTQALAGLAQGIGGLGADLLKDKPPTVEELNDILKQRGTYGGPSPTVTADIPINPSLSYGGPRADGGPVMPGQHYMVGERGPEMFVPNVPGQIVPSDPHSVLRDEEVARLLRGMMSDPNSVVRPSEMPSVERDFFGGRRWRR